VNPHHFTRFRWPWNLSSSVLSPSPFIRKRPNSNLTSCTDPSPPVTSRHLPSSPVTGPPSPAKGKLRKSTGKPKPGCQQPNSLRNTDPSPPVKSRHRPSLALRLPRKANFARAQPKRTSQHFVVFLERFVKNLSISFSKPC
jgi:hypothetical protein